MSACCTMCQHTLTRLVEHDSGLLAAAGQPILFFQKLCRRCALLQQQKGERWHALSKLARRAGAMFKMLTGSGLAGMVPCEEV